MDHTPIIILNKNRVSTLERLVDHLTILGYDNIYILDIASIYEPTLLYYTDCPAAVIYANDCGHKGFWTEGYINQFSEYQWIAVTDSDVELNVDTPADFIQQMIVAAKDFRVDKVGLAIQCEDITNDYLKRIVYPIESNYWKRKLVNQLECYAAPVDTTFCIVQPSKPFTYQAIRIAGNFTCKHIDWYMDFDNLTEEQKFYMIQADPNVSTTKAHYLNYLMNK